MKRTTILFAIMLFIGSIAISQQVTYQDNWGKQGFTLKKESKSQIIINHSTTSIDFGELEIDREIMRTISVPGVFLPNDEGAPNLPGKARYIAIPQGAEVSFKILSSRKVVLQNQEIAPAPRIPLDTEDDPLFYKKDMNIYSKNAYYPEEPVALSEISQIRGVDVVMLGITPFQYNPVTKELIIYKDLEIEVTFKGGNGQFGEDRLRSKWWDPIINDAIINPSSLPVMDYTYTPSANRTPDYEYVIITVDDPDYLAWADSIKNFRIQQGISTGVVTTTSLGGNTVANIKTYVDNAYSNWDSPPVAFLLLGDYATDATGVNSKMYVHPSGYPDFASDNYYSDFDGDNLPDMVFARITARNASELETMVTKFINYENNPPTSVDFYDKPITALGWQTPRWFQLCSEIVGGYFSNVQGKNPTRINAVYQGNPAIDPWSTASNTSTIVNYFGPNGLGYIPATPQGLGGFTGGTTADVTNAINNGSFLLQHRDHGGYTGWGEPDYNSGDINSLTNVNNELPFVFSINCMTGAYHRSSECFTEKFHRYSFNGQNSGALGLVAASQVSYSFVNDTYVWGIYDNMFPDFMPAYGTTFANDFVRPAFAHAAGKHFLAQSNWVSNSFTKTITYRLFHHHGGAFTTLYTEVPQNLTVSHNPELLPTQTSFTVTADDGSFIALTVNNQIIATAAGTGSPVAISIPNQTAGDIMKVTVTMQNFFRYSSDVPVIATGAILANFSADLLAPVIGATVSFTDLTIGSPISWAWTFSPATVTYVGGTSATDQNPQLTFDAAGNYTVTLTATNTNGSDVEVKTDYIAASVPINLQLSTGVLTNVGSAWQTVTLSETYISPVVVCAANYSSTNAPAVARVRNASGNTFEVKVQNPQQISLSGYTVHYMVVEEGVYTNAADGVKMEAHKYTSTVTDKKNSWVGESKSYSNSYSSPIVLGQVMTANDVDWSVFWTRGSATANPPSATAFYTGKHVGEETDAIRSNEEIGYIVLEAGTGTLANVGYSTGLGNDIVQGFNDSPPYIYTLSGLSTAGVAIVSGAAMDGGDGGWPVLYGDSPVSTTSLNLTIDEDQIGDTERNHTTEQVAYIIFEGAASAPVAAFTANNLIPDVGATVTFTDSSTENPTSWAWTFSPATVTYVGGTSATDQNPQLTFDAAGNYTVTLTATNASGSDDEIKTNYIVASTSSCPAITSYPYTQNFDAWGLSYPGPYCTNDGSVPLNDCWTNVVGEDIDWDIHSGNTVSGGTGASGDHTGAGNYLYTEASACFNHTGSILTPTFDLSALNTAQLTFWYNMRGNSMGTMSIQVSTDGGANWSANIWSLSGDQGTGWNQATVSLNQYVSSDNVVIRFTGLTGTSYNSDMAIDDVVVEAAAAIPVTVANFSANNVTPNVGGTVTFTDSSTENPTAWAWTFSPATVTYVGGTSATDQNPQLTFDAAGNYTVTLTATNASGSDDEVKTNYIVASTSSCPAITSYPYTQNFDAWGLSSPTAACTSDGSVPLSDCWTNVVGDDIDWDIKSGGTVSGGTGPSGDHTGSGNYLYTESSICFNNTGSILTPTFDLSSLTSAQLTFWYNMYGTNMGTMSIQVSTDGGANWSANIWSLSGNQGTGWNQATVSLSQYISDNVVIRFTGLTGSSYTSDMAIDDVVVDGQTTALTYCDPSFISGGYGDYISLVNLESINNTTTVGASPYYTYYSNLVTDLMADNAYVLTVSAGYYHQGNIISAWIDYNKDGDFAESERLGEVNLGAGPQTGTMNFTVPADATSGITRFRVRESFSTYNMSPCTEYSYGETEDYQVNIIGGSDAIGSGLSNTIPNISDDVLIYSNKNIVFIRKPASLTGQIDIYDMIGQRVITKKAGEETTIQIPVYKGLGYYVVRLVLNNQVVVKKVFIEQ